jgi:hypothetical protein
MGFLNFALEAPADMSLQPLLMAKAAAVSLREGRLPRL